MAEHPARITAVQQFRRLLVAVGHNHPALFKGATAFFKRIGHISKRLFRMVAQMCRESQRCRIKGGFGFGRNHQGLKRPQTFLGCHPNRGLFQHRMRIRPTDAQAVHAPPARAIRYPIGQPVIYPKRRCFKINRRVGRVVAQTRRQLVMVQR